VTIDLPHVLKNVAIDTSLEPIDVRVFLVAVPQLDDAEYRELKVASIANALAKSASLVSLSLRRLCSHGYLEVGPKKAGSVNSFRLSPFLTRAARH
jgi:hypothetical protein